MTIKLKKEKIDTKVLGTKSKLKGQRELVFNLKIWKAFANTSVSATNQQMKQMYLSSFHLYLISILHAADYYKYAFFPSFTNSILFVLAQQMAAQPRITFSRLPCRLVRSCD